jgi:heme-degrading monooxygenase HmoA
MKKERDTMAVKVIIKRIDRPGESLVVSTWQSMGDWRTWVMSDERRGTQEKIDHLLGEKTEYEVYTYD